jgi:CubicO group peptidase (beta-lactamase class C family)
MKNVLFLLLVTIVLGCTSAKREHVVLTTRLDSLLNAQVDGDGPGGAMLLAKKGKVIYAAAKGLADLREKKLITTQTLFNLGSISKTFVANAILILQAEGKLSVEDPLITYFPDFKNKDIAKKVKIKHLLTHTSGLPDNRQVSEDTVFYLTAKDVENWLPVTQTDTLAFEPGSRYEYSNPAYNGLALIVEQVSGMKWQQFVKERILQPSQMAQSTITDGAYPDIGVSHAYIKVNGTWVEDDYGEEPTFAAAGNGGVWSSVEELLSYEKAIQEGIFLTDSIISDSRRVKLWPTWLADEKPFIGWSWFIETTPDGLATVGHTGTQGGFYCNYVTVPEKEIVFIMLFNFPCDREKLTTGVLTQLAKEDWLDR